MKKVKQKKKLKKRIKERAFKDEEQAKATEDPKSKLVTLVGEKNKFGKNVIVGRKKLETEQPNLL